MGIYYWAPKNAISSFAKVDSDMKMSIFYTKVHLQDIYHDMSETSKKPMQINFQVLKTSESDTKSVISISRILLHKYKRKQKILVQDFLV